MSRLWKFTGSRPWIRLDLFLDETDRGGCEGRRGPGQRRWKRKKDKQCLNRFGFVVVVTACNNLTLGCRTTKRNSQTGGGKDAKRGTQEKEGVTGRARAVHDAVLLLRAPSWKDGMKVCFLIRSTSSCLVCFSFSTEFVVLPCHRPRCFSFCSLSPAVPVSTLSLACYWTTNGVIRQGRRQNKFHAMFTGVTCSSTRHLLAGEAVGGKSGLRCLVWGRCRARNPCNRLRH